MQILIIVVSFLVAVLAIGAQMLGVAVVPLSPLGIILLWVTLTVVTLALTSWVIVPQGSRYNTEWFGKYHRTLNPGFNALVPLVEVVAHKWDIRIQPEDVPSQVCTTKDNAQIEINGLLFWMVDDTRAASYNVAEVRRAVAALAQTTMRSVIGGMNLDDTFKERASINAEIIAAMQKSAASWGVVVTGYEVRDITYPQNIRATMEKQMMAERLRRATVTEAQGQKEAAILQAEGAKQAQILKAQGERDAAIALATGEAEAIRLVREQITAEGGASAVQLKVQMAAIEQYGALAKAGTNTVLMGDAATPAGFIANALAVAQAVGVPATKAS